MMKPTPDQNKEEIIQDRNEKIRVEIMRSSAKIYLSIAFGAAVLFFVAANLAGGYPPVAKFGGMLWVGLLSLIISMPLVTARVKKRLQK
jgi:hypothetical protein